MSHPLTSDLRNLALIGPAGSGKTSLAEAILMELGVIHAFGTVTAGTTTSDFLPEEIERKHSLSASLLHGEQAGCRINLIDTPGLADLAGQALTVMPAVETVALVVSATGPLDAASRRLLSVAAEQRLCRMVIVNKIDAPQANMPALLAELQDFFGPGCLPINLPAASGQAVLDCFFQAGPSEETSDLGSVDAAHTAIVDQVVEVDEALMTRYLTEGSIAPEALHEPFERALREGHLVPVCFTAAMPHTGGPAVGIAELVRVITELAPTPLEGNPRPFMRGDDRDHPLYAQPDPSQHLLAHVFHTRIDPFLGKLCAMRIHQGTLTPQTNLFIDDPETGELKKPIRPGHLYRMQGKHLIETDHALPGDLITVTKIDAIRFGSVLHDSHDEDQLHLLPLPLPTGVTGLAVSAHNRSEEQKLFEALHRLQEEDPTLQVARDAVTGAAVLQGLSDLHLRIALERIERRFHLKVETHAPRIAYRETISKPAEGHHRHKKQTGGAGQFGEVFLRIEPLERGAGIEFVNATVGGSIPGTFIPAIEKGVRQAMEAGPLTHSPIQDVRVIVTDGKHHPVDSKEIAFITAGRQAFLEAFQQAGPTVLEPMAIAHITASNQHLGDITADLAGRRGRIQATDMLNDREAIIEAILPMAELHGYASQLSSISAGQATYRLTFSHAEALPPHLQQKVVAEHAHPITA